MPDACRTRHRLLGAVLLTVATLTAACTSDSAPADVSAGKTSYLTPPSPDMTAIRHTIDAINATAGGPVTRQRAELDDLAAPTQLRAQQDCPVASTTLRFDPAYGALRTAPGDWTDDETASTRGTTYLLPTYITIYTDGRVTGTDLATLTLWVSDGTARTAALCVA